MRRRKFLGVAGASVAPAKMAFAQPAALRLQLLGLALELGPPDASGRMAVLPPASAALPAQCRVLAWQADLRGSTVYLRRVGLRYADASVFLRFEVPVVRSGDVFRPRPGSHPGGDPTGMCFIVAPTDSFPAGSGLRLDVGSLPVQGQFQPGALVVDAQGGLSLRMAALSGHSLGRIAPVELIVGTGLVALDLGQGTTEYAQGAFALKTVTVMAPRPDDYWTAGAREHALQRYRFSLGAVPNPMPLTFAGAPEPLPLHVERLGRTVPVDQGGLYVGMYATGYDLALTLVRDVVVKAAALRLAARAGATQSLTTFALADVHNVPVTWRMPPDVSIPLRVRWANAARPATLLLDPPLRDPARPAAGIQSVPESLADGRLHGDIADAVVHIGPTVYLKAAVPHHEQQGFDPANTPANLGDHFVPALLAEATAPMFEWQPGGTAIDRARPGNAYRGLASTPTVRNYQFAGAGMAMPAIALGHLEQASMRAFSARFRAALDSVVVPTMAAQAQPVVHESARQEVPVDPARPLRLSHVFSRGAAVRAVAPPPPPGRLPPPDDPLELAQFEVGHLFNIPNARARSAASVPLAIVVQRPAGAEPDYVVVETDGSLDHAAIPCLDFTLATNNDLIILDPAREVAGIPAAGGKGLPKALIKLSRNQSLAQILGDRAGYRELAAVLPSALQQPEWVGLMLFGVPAMLGQEGLLAGLLPKAELADLRFRYVAVTPKRQDAGGTLGYSVSAYLLKEFAPFANTDPSAAPSAQQEAAFGVQRIEASWDGSLLQSLRVDCMLRFYGFLGLDNPAPRDISIVGLFDRAANTLKFSAQLDRPLRLLPDTNESSGGGPIRQVWFKGAVVSMNGKLPHISIDGGIELNPFKVGSLPEFKLDNGGGWIDFDGLGIDLPDPTAGWRLCSINYPSLRMNIDGPRFAIGPLALKLFSIGLDVDNVFDWNRLVMLKGLPGIKLPCLLFGVRIELMKLPAILSSSVESLTFDLQIGAWPDLGRTHWPSINLAAGLSALGFEKLNLNLFRFLEVAADKATIEEQPAQRTTWIKLAGVSVKVCGTSILDNLNAAFYVRGAQSGFVLMAHWRRDVNAAFAVEWLLLGHNVVLPPRFIIDQMALTPPGRDVAFKDARDALANWSDVQCVPADASASSRDWLVGAGISALQGFFQGRFVYQEGQVCALSLQGEFLEWIGMESGIAGAYFKGRRAEDDHFYLSLTVPSVAVGPIAFVGGVVAVDFGVSGNVQLDLGFPWKNGDGSRQWYRTLEAIVTPFQGSGGFYVEHRRQLLADSSSTRTKLAAGYAVQAGLGAAFGGGIFTAWVTIGIYSIIEGDLYISGSRMVALRLSGAIGVLFRGHAGLNWWIISVDVDVCIGAEAGVSISWDEQSTNKHIQLHFDFTVYASACASACIRVGFIKVCKRISVSVPMRVQYALTM